MSEKTVLNPITNKCDILFLFDVVDGNPNGDPDAGNRPRQHRVDGDMRGFVTGECIKRKNPRLCAPQSRGGRAAGR